jgi:drug/metabolite transporter (DMT)-like permease
MTNLLERAAGLSNNVRGALWMLASAAAFTIATTLIKFLGSDYGPALQTFYRQLAGLIVLLPFIIRDPRGSFHTSRPGILIFRALAGTIGMVAAFYAYQKMPLAEANALSFTRNLWLVPLAVFVLGEKVGPVRIGATLVGFLGVLLMLQPSAASGFGLPAICALVSALLFAFTVTGMKVMTRDHSTMVLVVWSSALGLVLSIPLALLEWKWPEPLDLLLLFLMGALSLGTQTFYIRGMALGDAAAMAPLDYTRLIFAVLIGLVFFAEVPNGIAMTGAAIVIGATLYITIREARLAKLAPPATD